MTQFDRFRATALQWRSAEQAWSRLLLVKKHGRRPARPGFINDGKPAIAGTYRGPRDQTHSCAGCRTQMMLMTDGQILRVSDEVV